MHLNEQMAELVDALPQAVKLWRVIKTSDLINKIIANYPFKSGSVHKISKVQNKIYINQEGGKWSA